MAVVSGRGRAVSDCVPNGTRTRLNAVELRLAGHVATRR